MADLDEDLLDLAGGDSGDEGSIAESRERSVSPPPKKKSKNASAKKTKRRTGDESEEEGEASSEPRSPGSDDSAPMDESDSEAEPSRAKKDDDFNDKYPVEGMFVSHAEKAQIMALGELEREQILNDRATELNNAQVNRRLRQMAENTERQAAQKRSADAAELDEGTRTGSRQRTDKDETAIESFRRARADKKKRREDQERRRDKYSPRAHSPGAESDDSYGRAKSRTPEPDETKDLPPPELRDYDRVRLGRNEFAQVCFTPGFEASIIGCYIRIALGPHPETGIDQYRMALIKGFTTSRPYALSGPNGSFVTDQYVKAAHGKSSKEFPFIAASSGKFTEAEVSRYQVTCHNDGVTLPTKAFLSDKVDDINNLINHKWTNEEIKARLARKNELMKRFDPSERERVSRLLEEARERGDDNKAEELQEQLDKLGSQRLAFRTSLGANKNSASKKQTEQDRLAERNRENRRLNAEAVRKAQLKEMARTREIEQAISRGELVEDDPSRRVKTKAKFVHDVNEKSAKKDAADAAAASAAANGTPKGNTTKSMPSHLAKLQEESFSEKKGLPGIHKPLMDDDVIGSLDLDIDVEI
ncbi:unnamed protein product [Clonostachys rhizophaga]|uniref:Plus3 domain-containing protein n=1 Tax=Clonostachys rhizophaga TaxID=160324 RepID=A0A9N9YCS2_9HYPO|nr:unnamed protein product [Clonostachys rhizophaga]